MSDGAPPAAPPSLAGHLEALNLAGLASAGGALLGGDPERVTSAFRRWAHAQRDALPALPQLCWTTLRPVGVSRPALPAAVILDGVLAGTAHDPDDAAAALAEASAVAQRLSTDAPLVEDGVPLADQLRRRALVSATKEFWRTLSDAYRDARPAVVQGDLDAAVARLERARTALAPVVERLDVLAHRVAGLDPPAGLAPGASAAAPRSVAQLSPAARRASTERDRPEAGAGSPQVVEAAATAPATASEDDGWGDVEVGRLGRSTAPPPGGGLPSVRRAGDRTHAARARPAGAGSRRAPARRPAPGTPAPAPAPAPPARGGGDVRRSIVRQGWRTVELLDDGDRSPIPRLPGRPDEVLKRRPPREHPFVPIVFLLLVTGAALAVLVAVIGGGGAA